MIKIKDLAGKKFLGLTRTLLLTSLVISITACSTPDKLPEIYWPTPPDAPRIQFDRAIYSSRELKKEGFMSKLREIISGEVAAQGMAKPFGMFAKGGRLFVSDTVQRGVFVFDFEKSTFSRLGTSGQGKLAKPLDIFADDEGTIYVADATAKKIVVYNKDMEFVRAIGKKGEIDRPGGVVVNLKLKRMYVTDIIRHNVHVYDLEGNKLFDFGQRGAAEGEFNYPTSMAINKDGDVFIVDSMNFRVQVFDPDGKLKFKFGNVGDQFGDFARPKGIALDSEGHIYVSDAAFNNIQIFDNKGRLLLFFANMGYNRGNLWMPSGLAIDEKNYIYVADQYNHRVNVYKYLTEEEGNKILKEDESKDKSLEQTTVKK